MDNRYLVENLFGIEGLNIAWYAVLICSGIVAGILVGRYMAKRRGYNFDLVIDFVLLAVPLALIGARAYYVAMEWDNYAGTGFMNIIAVWNGGLAIYGGVIGGFIAVLIFCKWRKVSIGHMVDIAAPALILGHAIGRWGNFVNQEAFGEAVTEKSLQWFPYAVNITRDHKVLEFNEELGKMVQVACTESWHQATFFYESVWNLLTFAAIIIIDRKMKKKRRGDLFVWYLILYGAGRAIIEGFRTDSLWLIPNLVRVSQALAIVCVVLGIAYLIISRRFAEKPYNYIGKIYELGYKPDKKKKNDVQDAAEEAEDSEAAVEVTEEIAEDAEQQTEEPAEEE